MGEVADGSRGPRCEGLEPKSSFERTAYALPAKVGKITRAVSLAALERAVRPARLVGMNKQNHSSKPQLEIVWAPISKEESEDALLRAFLILFPEACPGFYARDLTKDDGEIINE